MRSPSGYRLPAKSTIFSYLSEGQNQRENVKGGKIQTDNFKYAATPLLPLVPSLDFWE